MARILRSEAGVTLVEAMIAGALVMIIAVAILPGFAQLNNSAKISSFRVACNAMVKAKLN